MNIMICNPRNAVLAFPASQMLILNGVGLLIDLWSLAGSKKSDTTTQLHNCKSDTTATTDVMGRFA